MGENKPTNVATAAEADGLADIRRRGNWIWAWPFASIAVMLAAGSLLGERSVVVFLVLAAIFFWVTGRHMLARCPRCREYFNWSRRRRHQFAQACVNCGLELSARSENEAS